MSLVNVVRPPRDIYEVVELVQYTSATSLTLIYTYTFPVSGFLDMFVEPIFGNAAPSSCAISTDTDISHYYNILAKTTLTYDGTARCSISGYQGDAGKKLYIFTSHAAANSNRAYIFARLTAT